MRRQNQRNKKTLPAVARRASLKKEESPGLNVALILSSSSCAIGVESALSSSLDAKSLYPIAIMTAVNEEEL